MKESTYKARIHRALKQIDPTLLIWNISNRFADGYPDTFYLALDGTTLWVEYKQYPNVPTARQRYVIRELLTHHQKVAVITRHNPKKYVIDDGTFVLEVHDPLPWITSKLGLMRSPP